MALKIHRVFCMIYCILFNRIYWKYLVDLTVRTWRSHLFAYGGSFTSSILDIYDFCHEWEWLKRFQKHEKYKVQFSIGSPIFFIKFLDWCLFLHTNRPTPYESTHFIIKISLFSFKDSSITIQISIQKQKTGSIIWWSALQCS